MAIPRNLHYEVEGAGSDLVLLHPIGLDHSFMGPLLAATSRAARFVSIDLRGHGRSPAADANASFDDYVSDIHDVMTRACSGPAIVLGLSFGGMLAQSLALTYPGAVSGLVLCGCPAGFASEVRPMLRERGVAAQRDGMAAVVEPTVERWFTPSFRSHPLVDSVRTRLLADDPANWSAAWHAISTFDALPRLGEIEVPTLVVSGERDAATPLSASEVLRGAIPNARLTVLAGAPHMMQLECREVFDTTVAAFIAEVAGTSRGS